MLEIPGYRFDEATNRYFRETQQEQRQRQQQERAVKVASRKERKGRRNRRLESERQEERDEVHVAPGPSASGSGSTSSIALSTRSGRSRRLPAHQHGSTTILDVVASGSVEHSILARTRLQQNGLIARLATLYEGMTIAPDLAIGDTVNCFDFDVPNTGIVRYGSSTGLIGHGSLAQPINVHHNVDDWRADHMLGSAITSLSTASGKLLATSFGPVAQAIYANTSQTFVSGSIILQPRKTSLWSSALSADGRCVALGCDKKLLLCSNPASSEMQAYGTGSAVFSTQFARSTMSAAELLIAGTRSGQLRCYDMREGRTQAQLVLRMLTSITHARLYGHNKLIVALMDGQVDLFDTRFLPGNSNLSNSEEWTGFSVNDSGTALAAAGEDCQIRIWSLENGERVDMLQQPVESSPPATRRLRQLQLEAPVRDIKWTVDTSGRDALWFADGPIVQQYRMA